ncbi:MAG: hypothetical protein U1E98_04205 [Moraxella osloensis]
MSAVATPSHARTVKAAAKKTTTVTTNRVAPKTTTIVNQHIDGTSDTVMVRPNGFTIVDGMPFLSNTNWTPHRLIALSLPLRLSSLPQPLL